MNRLALGLVLTLAACSPASEEQEKTAPQARDAATAAAPRAALTAEDVEGARLAGELSCAFTERGMREPLLIASADVDDAAHPEGVLKLGSSTLRLKSTAAGGFNAMVEGARFTSGELAAQVWVTSRQPLDESESPPLAAVLELEAPAIGAQRIDGEWACGP